MNKGFFTPEFGYMRTVFTFVANYSRRGVVDISIDVCARCGQKNPCLTMDGSEGEYGGCDLCLDCIAALFDDWEKARTGNERSK